MHHYVAVSLYNTEQKDAIGFGRGIVELLERIDRTGSIYSAAKEMGMAYSKAWSILRSTESEFDCSLLTREGQHGSQLTEEARLLMTRYHEMLDAANAAALQVFQKYY